MSDAGPRSFGELASSHRGFVKRALQRIGGAEKTFKHTIDDGDGLKIILSTDYSGMGSFEFAGDLVLDSLGSLLSLPALPQCVACHRAADLDQHCRKLLMSHVGHFAPKHVQADILDRLDKVTLNRLQAILKKHKARATRRLSITKKESKPTVLARQGKLFMTEAATIMMNAEFKKKSFCHVHNGQCDVHPTEEQRRDAMYVIAGGNTCVAWSRMGAQEGWLHESSIVFLVWIYDIFKCGKPDIILQECTEGFDEQTLYDIIGSEYHTEKMCLCPRDLGAPVKRKRQFVLARKKDSINPIAAFSRPVFQDIFFKEVSCDARIFWRAPIHDVDAFFEKMAIDRFVPNHPESGFDWIPEELLTGTMQKRLEQYTELARRKGLTFAVYNLAQNPGFMNHVDGNIPTLTRKSFLWGTHIPNRASPCARPLMPYEHLAAMGWPVLLPETHNLSKKLPMKLRYNVWTANKGPKPKTLRSMAGNGMHVLAMCSIWTFILTTSDFKSKTIQLRKRPMPADESNDLKAGISCPSCRRRRARNATSI